VGETTQAILPCGRSTVAELSDQIRQVSSVVSLSFMMDFPVAMLVLNGNRQIVFSNDRATEFMGPDHQTPLGLRPGEAFACVHAKDGTDGCGTGSFCRYCGAARSLASALTGLTKAEECSLDRSRTERLEQLDLLIWTKPVLIGDSCFYLYAIIDISEKKRRESLERIFLHDLMNTAGSLSSLMRLIDPREDSFKEYFSLARGAADQLVDELVSHRMLSDAETGILPADFVLVSASEICLSIAEIYTKIVESRGLTLSLEKGKGPILLQTDPVLLRRVLANLLKNAMEASERGQVITLAYDALDGFAEFSVSNPAVIPEAVLSQLFHRSFSTKGRGRGLGTYAARLFTEEFLGGTIRVESEEGKGTTFTVRIPTALPDGVTKALIPEGRPAP
ncbi:MAG: ATP-binding protein, partial [Treponemataceae bacterium]